MPSSSSGCRGCCTVYPRPVRRPQRPIAATCLFRLTVRELHQAEDATTFIPLPREPRCRRAAERVLANPARMHDIAALALEVGIGPDAVSAVFRRDATEFQELVPARPHRRRDRKVSVSRIADQTARRRSRLRGFPAFPHAFRQVTAKRRRSLSRESKYYRRPGMCSLGAGPESIRPVLTFGMAERK